MVAIPLWATWPALATRAAELPAFELLAITYLVGWLVLHIVEPAHRRETSEPKERRPSGLFPVLACAFGLSGSNAFFIFASRTMPPAQAHLIAYLWPVMIVAFGGILGLFRLRVRHGLGLALGFVGAALVVGPETLTLSLQGIGLALMSGASWALYCLYRLWQRDAAANVLASGCGVSVLACIGLHLALESTVVPRLATMTAAIASGIGPLALANLTWDQGFRRGDGQLLAVMAYGTPILSALLLIALGLAAASPGLLIGAPMIVGAGLLSRADGSASNDRIPRRS
jgi:drug/metabolite transporter (DMT)-like permease